MITNTWYLLYDGYSVDGMGRPKYIGRTYDKAEAMEHALKCSKDPYCTGHTMCVTDTTTYHMRVRKRGKTLVED